MSIEKQTDNETLNTGISRETADRSVEDELLQDIEVAPDAWIRPGADALVSATVQWSTESGKIADARELIRHILGANEQDDIELEVEERVTKLTDPEQTAKVREWLQNSDNPTIAAAREKLGITQHTERPFELAVLSIDSGLHTSSGDPKAVQAEWSSYLTSAEGITIPPAFVRKPSGNKPALLVLDKETAIALLDPNNASHNSAVKTTVHEYGHAQRDITTTSGIGNGLEERMAIIAAGGQAAYPGTMVHAHILNALTDGEYSLLFNDVMSGKATMNELYSKVLEAAGPQAALALAAIPPDVDHYKLPDYAQPFLEQGETNAMAIYRNLTESVDIGKIAAGFESANNVTAKWIMNNAMATGITLHSKIVVALIARLEPSDTPEWYAERLLSQAELSNAA